MIQTRNYLHSPILQRNRLGKAIGQANKIASASSQGEEDCKRIHGALEALSPTSKAQLVFKLKAKQEDVQSFAQILESDKSSDDKFRAICAVFAKSPGLAENLSEDSYYKDAQIVAEIFYKRETIEANWASQVLGNLSSIIMRLEGVCAKNQGNSLKYAKALARLKNFAEMFAYNKLEPLEPGANFNTNSKDQEYINRLKVVLRSYAPLEGADATVEKLFIGTEDLGAQDLENIAVHARNILARIFLWAVNKGYNGQEYAIAMQRWQDVQDLFIKAS